MSRSWSSAHDWKSCRGQKLLESSNLSISATFAAYVNRMRRFLFACTAAKSRPVLCRTGRPTFLRGVIDYADEHRDVIRVCHDEDKRPVKRKVDLFLRRRAGACTRHDRIGRGGDALSHLWPRARRARPGRDRCRPCPSWARSHLRRRQRRR